MTDLPDREKFCSFAPVTDEDLQRLRDIALAVKEDRGMKKPATAGRFRNQFRLMCLCQGAALHRVNLTRGVHDFDVWCFFERLQQNEEFPGYRTASLGDFGASYHGRNPDDPAHFVGRRIDVWFRAIAFNGTASDVEGLRRYLRGRRTTTAKYLAERPIIGLWPEAVFGQELWTTNDAQPSRTPHNSIGADATLSNSELAQ